jgi:hypothetical protein
MVSAATIDFDGRSSLLSSDRSSESDAENALSAATESKSNWDEAADWQPRERAARHHFQPTNRFACDC